MQIGQVNTYLNSHFIVHFLIVAWIYVVIYKGITNPYAIHLILFYNSLPMIETHITFRQLVKLGGIRRFRIIVTKIYMYISNN